MKKLVIFDLDGTLLNTIEDLGQAANYALERNGYATHSMASYPYFVGNGVRRLITRVLPEDARDDETVERVLGDFLEFYDEHCTDYTKPYNGMPELLQDLRDQGVAMAVASNKYQKAVDKIIPHFFPDINLSPSRGTARASTSSPTPVWCLPSLPRLVSPKPTRCTSVTAAWTWRQHAGHALTRWV